MKTAPQFATHTGPCLQSHLKDSESGVEFEHRFTLTEKSATAGIQTLEGITAISTLNQLSYLSPLCKKVNM